MKAIPFRFLYVKPKNNLSILRICSPKSCSNFTVNTGLKRLKDEGTIPALGRFLKVLSKILSQYFFSTAHWLVTTYVLVTLKLQYFVKFMLHVLQKAAYLFPLFINEIPKDLKQDYCSFQAFRKTLKRQTTKRINHTYTTTAATTITYQLLR